MSEPFDTIATLLRRHSAGLTVSVDGPDHLQFNRVGGTDGKREFVASAKVGKRYVALHLMPLYCHPALVADMPEVLRPRMHGKSCLNFPHGKAVPEVELEALIVAALAAPSA